MLKVKKGEKFLMWLGMLVMVVGYFWDFSCPMFSSGCYNGSGFSVVSLSIIVLGVVEFACVVSQIILRNSETISTKWPN